MLKRTLNLIFAAVFTALFAAKVFCAEDIRPQYSYVLMEGNTASLLYSENGSASVPAYHSAKLMTLLLTVEAIERGELSFDTVVTASAHANSMQGAQIWLMPGEQISVDELVKAVTVGNANDACVVLAETVGKTEENFVGLMNKRADELGMIGTKYTDSTGISEKTVTTACDAAILASELTKYACLREYFTTWITSVRGGKTELASTNRLILSYDGAIGMKAYYSKAVGNCLIAAAERDGLIMICVIFGESDEFRRFTTAKEKMNTGFLAYTLYSPKATDIYTEPVSVKGGEQTEVGTELGELTKFVIRKSAEDKINISVEYSDSITAPLEKGDRVGRAIWSIDGEEIYSCAIVASENVKKLNIFLAVRRALFSVLKM